MTIQEQQFLIATMNLSIKLKTNDTTVMDDIAVINASALLTDNAKLNISNIIEDECNEVTTLNKDLLKKVINSLEFLDQAYFFELIEFTIVDKLDKKACEEYLNIVLSRQFTFKDPRRLYFFFTRLVNMCIVTRNSDLIKKAIDKIQSIPVI